MIYDVLKPGAGAEYGFLRIQGIRLI